MSRAVAVVGAGAAGLAAALRAAEGGAAVTLLNAHPRIGLKILMSGGTRCNVTHREVSERDFNGGSPAFVRRILRAFPAESARAWLEGLGVPLKLEATGKIFPTTDDARTVLDALLGAVERAGVRVTAGARVIRLERRGPAGAGAAPAGFRLGVHRVRDSAAFAGLGVSGQRVTDWPLPAREPDEWLEAGAVILATGGLSFPRTGSDGTGYALATGLGHTLEPPIPALTPLVADDPLCRAAQGIALDAELCLWTEGKRAVTVRGSLLVTHFGFSGPAALDFSRHWLRGREEGRGGAARAAGRARAGSMASLGARGAAAPAERATAAPAGGEGEPRCTVSFLPGERPESVRAQWRKAADAAARLTVRRLIARRVPDRLAVALCGEAGIDPAATASQVSRDRRDALIERLLARPLPIGGTLGYEKAEVTAGGVRLDEVDPSTLESRKARGLYLCGEILDVEGRLGGFNFQWAWSSGTVAGRAAAR